MRLLSRVRSIEAVARRRGPPRPTGPLPFMDWIKDVPPGERQTRGVILDLLEVLDRHESPQPGDDRERERLMADLRARHQSYLAALGAEERP